MTVDVAIVGAGVGGAVLAWDLGRRGWRVAVLVYWFGVNVTAQVEHYAREAVMLAVRGYR